MPPVKFTTSDQGACIECLRAVLGHRVRLNNQLKWAFMMAAPPPPPAGAGAGAGGAGAPPPPPPGGGPGAPPPPPPGGSPGGPNLLAQLVQAMQLAAAALPPPGPGAPPRVKIPPPIFKGLPGERPEAHLMRANDWMDTYLIPVVQKPVNFKHTLDHLA